jgi:hypothetical protein
MEFVERIPLTKAHYLLTLKFNEYKAYDKSSSKNDDERKKNYEKMRRFCETFIKANGEIKRLYKFTGGHNWGENKEGSGRLFADGNGIQGLPKKIRGFFLNDTTTDIDMVNAHPTILRYLCRIHNISHIQLNMYIEKRDEILAQFSDRETGKTLFLKATNDENLNKKEKNPVFKAYDKEMKEIQKILTKLTCYKDIVADVPENKIYNWYGSAINRILCFFENKILQVILSELNKRMIEICSPMFDGCMVYGIHTEELLVSLENAINVAFPQLDMKLSLKEHCKDIVMPDDFVIPASIKENNNVRYAESDNIASEYIYEELKEIFISYKGRLFYKYENIWISDSCKIDDIILTKITESNIYKKTDNKDIPYCQNVKSAKNIRELLYSKIRTYNENQSLYDKFHRTTRGRLCFLDGVLDFKSKRFYTWDFINDKSNNFELYSCQQIKRNFKNYFENPDNVAIEKVKNEIIENMFGDKSDIALHFLSRAIAGEYEDKNWASYLGNRNCGKGVLYDGFKYAFECYVNPFELGNILYHRKTAGMENVDCSKKLYWTIDLEFVRLAISQEVPDSKTELKANSKILKKLAGGGDTIVARRNYDRVDTYFTIDTTFLIMGNNSLEVDNEDCNEQRIEFNSVNQFKTLEEINLLIANPSVTELELSRYKVKDIEIKNRCKTEQYMNAIVYLLFQNYKDYPVSINKNITEDEEDLSLLGQLKETFEFTYDENNIELCSDVNSILNNFDKGKIQNELNAINIFRKRITKGINKGKFGYFGMKQKHNTNIDEK